MSERSDLSWWYPRLADLGVLTPATVILPAPKEASSLLADEMWTAGNTLGYPLFLRTGTWAAKGAWRRTCWVDNRHCLPRNVRNLTHLSAQLDRPLRSWALRQVVPLVSYFCLHTSEPVGREFRLLVRDGVPLCAHPLWSRDIILRTGATQSHWWPLYETGIRLDEPERRILFHLSAHVGRHLPGNWMIDWALTVDGRWTLIDMEEEEDATHEECPYRPEPGITQPAAPAADTWTISPESRSDLPLLGLLARSLEEGTDITSTTNKEKQ